MPGKVLIPPSGNKKLGPVGKLGGNSSKLPTFGSTTKAAPTGLGVPARELRHKEATRGTKGTRQPSHAHRASMDGPGKMCRPGPLVQRTGEIGCATEKLSSWANPKTNPQLGTTCRMCRSVRVWARSASQGHRTKLLLW
eukprot:116631-Amphidinium_carterae.1